jgi:outer membrane biosynthesis protein TonB
MTEQERRRQHERRQTRTTRGGLLASIALHLLVLALFADRSPIPVSPFAAAGERRGSELAAAGGGMRAIELATPTEETPTPPPPEPVPTPVEEVPPPEEEMLVEVPAIALAEGTMTPGDAGDTGPGLALGVGEGDGGTEAEGRFRVVPPRPRGLILPPRDPPESIRGKEVEVWVYVSAAGRVVPDSTRIRPPTGDRRFDRRLRDHASGWVFEAARKDGRSVGEWFRYTIVM